MGLRMADPFEDLKQYLGKSRISEDVATASQIGRLAASLDVDHPAPGDGDEIPAGWHGVFFPPLAPLSALREDGQPAADGIMPPVLLPRRRLTGVSGVYHGPIRIGDKLTKTTEIAGIDVDDRGAGPLVSVTVRDSIETSRGIAVTDERGFQFFGADGPGREEAPPQIPAEAAWRRSYDPTPVMMFRTSAVRYNSHRVHFDRDYTMGVEGHPGLVVPVTLISALMLELCRAELPERTIGSFVYRSVQRIYDLGPFSVCGAPNGESVVLWATNHEGALGVTAQIEFAP